tara:strand:- start:453 stop:3038 length:2586 start_codon:yes stop_codon:yes gene_type:complete
VIYAISVGKNVKLESHNPLKKFSNLFKRKLEMDVLIDRSRRNGGLINHRQGNFYKNQRTNLQSVFFQSMNNIIPPDRAFINQDFIDSFDNIYQYLDEMKGMAVYKQVLADCDPVKGIFTLDDNVFTRDYYIMRGLDSTYNLISNGDSVLTATPRARKYFEESGCETYNLIYLNGSETIATRMNAALNNEKLHTNAGHDNFLNSSRILFDATESNLGVRMNNPSIASRWGIPEFVGEDKINVDLILIEESSEGRLVEFKNREYDQKYDPTFTESMLQFPLVLNNGGNALVNLYSLGSAHIAQWIYIYSMIFEEVMIVKALASEFIGFDHSLVARGFKKNVFEAIYPIILPLVQAYTNMYNSGNTQLEYPPLIKLEDDNFTEWLIQMNSTIAWYTLCQIETVSNGLNERKMGYKLNVPLFDLDHTKLNHQYNIVFSPTRYYEDYDMLAESNRLRQEIITMPSDELLTETGQTQIRSQTGTIIGDLTLHETKINLKFAVYLGFEQGFIPTFMTTYKRFIGTRGVLMSDHDYEIYSNLLREWIESVYLKGNIRDILNVGGKSEEEAKKLLYKIATDNNWSYYTIFGHEVGSFGNTDTIVSVVNALWSFSLLATRVITMDSKTFKFRLRMLKNFKYLFTYNWNGFRYTLQFRSKSDIISDEQIYNLMSPEERKNIKLNELHLISQTEQMALRIANQICFTVIMGNRNTLHFKDLSSIDKYDIELFGNVWHRESLNWGSNYPTSAYTNSLGKIDKVLQDLDSDALDHLNVLTMLVIPPAFKNIVTDTIKKCTDLLESYMKKEKSLRIYFVLGDTMKRFYEDLLKDAMEAGIEIDVSMIDEIKYVHYAINNDEFKKEAYKIYCLHTPI